MLVWGLKDCDMTWLQADLCSRPMQLAIASYLWRRSRYWVGWIVLILQLNICTYIAQFNRFNQEWMSTQWIYQNLRDVISLHLNNLNTKWMNLFKIWWIQLTNISAHPASSWECRSSNQVIWLWLKACHMVTALAFECIGLSFLLMGFQHVDSATTQTLCWKYFPPRFDILVHPCPSLHMKHVLIVMQKGCLCVAQKVLLLAKGT